jgi:hypothetical protein
VAKIPQQPNDLVAQLYSWRASRQDAGWRGHLGASVIGGACDRSLWYTFRWCTRSEFSGRILRLFDRGQREEAVFVEELRGIGCEVHDGENGTQFRVSFCAGHVGGSLDAAILGVPEAPKTWHVGEFKTHGSKSFRTLQRDGVQKANPEHYAQMLVYMLGTGMTRALYLAVNKDTDELYAERIHTDANEARRLVARAEQLVVAAVPPTRIADDASWWQCKFCNHSGVCHAGKIPAVNCRTCLHATPEMDGDGRWSCAAWHNDPPIGAQRFGCPRHAYLPCLLASQWEQVDATDSGVVYADGDGRRWEQGPGGISSAELERMAEPRNVTEPLVQAALDAFPGAEVVA